MYNIFSTHTHTKIEQFSPFEQVLVLDWAKTILSQIKKILISKSEYYS